MEKLLENLTNKILNRIRIDKQEYSIIEYGIHQMILSGLNLLAVIVFGILWDEMLFSMLLLIWVMILRPFAGGYHADTELKCYMMSIIILNCILGCKKNLVVPTIYYLAVGIVSVVIIFIFAPVENTNNLLDDDQVKKYGKKARKLVIGLLSVILISAELKIKVIYSSIIYSLLLVSVALLVGKVKYQTE